MPTPRAALLTMARPKNHSKPLPFSSSSSLHRPNRSSFFFYHYFPVSPSPSQSSPLSQSLAKTPRKPSLLAHHHLTLRFFLLLLLLLLVSSLALLNIPSLRVSPLTTACGDGSATTPSESRHAMAPLPVHKLALVENATEEEREFWRQPDGRGYRPCIEFSLGYRRASARIAGQRRRFVVAEVSGGLNQQRKQVVDAVVIARILGAALVVPVLKPNVVWGDASAFSEIFDVDHFIRTLRSAVRVVPSLPPSHRGRPFAVVANIPFNVSPVWIRAKFQKKLSKNGVLILKGLDSKLSKDLPLDLQKLRCKVAFQALRFAPPILALGERLARRMWADGPYVAVHLRLELDVWVRTGCLPGLGSDLDRLVLDHRQAHPELLTSRLNGYRAAGRCPLNARQVARLLRALGAPRSARVYVAGGEPLGGDRALEPLAAEFPNLFKKETLASDGELEPYANKSSVLAAVDFVVATSSDVFVPSHGGNMGRAIQGYRAFVGHRKTIWPNKRALVQLLRGDQGPAAAVEEDDVGVAVRRAHRGLLGQPEDRGRKEGRDVIAFPVPECMCRPRLRLYS